MKLSIVVPAFQEEKVIATTLDRILEFVKSQPANTIEVVVVDDGSTDQTRNIVSRYEGIRLIRHTKNRGKGAAVQTGFREARGDFVLLTDADNSTDIFQASLLRQVATDTTIAIGSRAISGADVAVAQPFFKVALGRLGNKIIQFLLLKGIKDSRCGFKLYPRSVAPLVAQLRCLRWSFDDELLYLARKKGYTIVEIPIRWINRFETKVTLQDYLTTLFDIFRVKLGYLFGKYKI